MKAPAVRTAILLLVFCLFSAPLAFANSHSEEYESEGLELSVLSGLLVFLLLLSTVIVALLMKKGKVSVKTHHTLAFTTLVLALFHGVFNFLTH
jgi:phosphoglycerol transferase MdoB-like AlkP superfamily enzyme